MVKARDLLLLLAAILLLAVILAAALLVARDRHVRPPSTPLPGAPTSTSTQPPASTPHGESSPTPGAHAAMPGRATLPVTTATPTATRAPSATPSPTPSPNPAPAALLAEVHRARRNGDYATARAELERARMVATDPDQVAAAEYQAALLAYHDGDLKAARERLHAFIAKRPDDHRVPAAHFYRAETLALLGEYPAAIEHYTAYLARQDVLADLVYARIGRIHRFTGDPTAAAAAYAQAVERAPDLATELDLHEQQALALQAAGDYAAAGQAFRAIVDRSENAYRLARIWYRIGGNYRLLDQEQDALDAYAQAIAGDARPGYAHAALVELVNAGVEVDEYRRGLINYYAGSYQAAVEAFARYVQAAPAAKPVLDAYYYAARSYLAQGDPARALDQVESALAQAGDESQASPRWGELWLLKAETEAHRREIDRAVQTYLEFAHNYPEHPVAPEAIWQAARQLEWDDQHAEAADRYNTLADHYPDADQAPQARFRAGLWRYWIGDLDGALGAWQELAQTHPATDAGQQGRYWLGKTLWARGWVSEARLELETLARQYPRSYYGLRAAQLLAEGGQTPTWRHAPRPAHLTYSEGEERQEALAWLRTWADLSAFQPDRPISTELSGNLRFRRAVELHALGLREQARAEFDTLRQTLKEREAALLLYQLALVTRDLELYAPSLRAVIDLTVLAPEENAVDMPRLIQRLAYPAYYPDLVLAESAAHSLDPLLVFALIRQESLYDDQVASWAGAVGLAQIMPATGQWIAEMIAWPQYDKALLQRAYLNVKFGAWFLNRILDQAGGDVFTALAGYNGGPGLALGWQEQARGDPDLLLEIIPKSETQRYLRAIYRHYDMYARLYSTP